MSVDNTYGAALIGVVSASILFGVTSLQAYLYFHHFPKDPLLHKNSVIILWCLDAFHMALTMHVVYHYLVTGFGHVDLNIVWSIKAQIVVNVVIVLIVQSLYAYRVWLLGGYHHGILGYLVASVVAAGFVIGTVLAYEIFTIQTFTQLQSIGWAVNSSLSAATAIDFTISMAMCYYLRKSKGKGSHLNSRISMVMQYSLSSGLFTSACSLSCLFTYTLLPNTLIYLGLEFILTKLYVGSFLAMLNARPRRSDYGSSQSDGPLSSIPILPTRTPSTRTYASPTKSPLESALSEQRSPYPWHADVQVGNGGRPRPAVHSKHHHYGLKSQELSSPTELEKPQYMYQW